MPRARRRLRHEGPSLHLPQLAPQDRGRASRDHPVRRDDLPSDHPGMARHDPDRFRQPAGHGGHHETRSTAGGDQHPLRRRAGRAGHAGQLPGHRRPGQGQSQRERRLTGQGRPGRHGPPNPDPRLPAAADNGGARPQGRAEGRRPGAHRRRTVRASARNSGLEPVDRRRFRARHPLSGELPTPTPRSVSTHPASTSARMWPLSPATPPAPK